MTITDPWTAGLLTLVPVPMAALDALQQGDLRAVQAALPSLAFPTDWAVSDRPKSIWHRRWKQVTEAPEDGPWIARLVVLGEEAATDKSPSAVATPSNADATVLHGSSVSSGGTTGTVIGMAGFHGRPDARGMLELGYALDPTFHRRGYGAAAARLILETARQQEGVKVLRASIVAENAGSVRVATGLGMTRVGREWDVDDACWEDVYEMSLE